jgi:hypothetical protein
VTEANWVPDDDDDDVYLNKKLQQEGVTKSILIRFRTDQPRKRYMINENAEGVY